VLGVSPAATHDEVREAYRRLALETHPDRVAASGELDAEDAELLIRAVNEAWQVLGDPVRRAAYDADLARRQRDGTDDPRAADDDDWADEGDDERWPAERPSSVIAGLLPLLVLVALLLLVVVFTAYARTG
jgi:curved DNA-binding protein CbpA